MALPDVSPPDIIQIELGSEDDPIPNNTFIAENSSQDENSFAMLAP
jgi:hypothetical protein